MTASSRAASRPPSGASGRAAGPVRLGGVDAARGLALLGMIATHIMVLTASTGAGAGAEPTVVGLVFAGKSSALFATLAGVGLALLTGGPRQCTARSGSRLDWDRRYVALRAVLLFALGLFCGSLETNVAVILCHYALLFLLALPFLGLGARTLAFWAAGWVVISPLVASALSWVMQRLVGAEQYVEGWRLWSSPTFLDVLARPGLLLWDLLFTGYYPVLQWMGYVLLGLCLGRLVLSRLTVAGALAVGGAAVAVVAFSVSRGLQSLPGVREAIAEGTAAPLGQLDAQLLTGAHIETEWIQDSVVWFTLATPHSGAPLDLILTGGTSAMVLGGCLLVHGVLRKAPGGILTWPLLPLIGAGALPLTLYVGHLVALDVLEPVTADWPRLGVLIAYWTGCLVLGALFRGMGWRGPLERVLGRAAGTLAGSRP